MHTKLSALLVLLLSFQTGSLQAADHVNVLIYHHVAEDTPPSTTISPEKFVHHLNKLDEEGFKVVDLEWAINEIQAGRPVPDKSVAITFDDGFADIYINAYPELKKRNMPFTLFIATDPIDQKQNKMMTWDMIREMKANGATVANHTTDHDYLVRKDLDDQWLESTMANIERAQLRLEQELGETPKWLAYPYGEYHNRLRARLKQDGWTAFGQQSGGIDINSDYQALPRFPAAGIYSNWNPLRTKLKSKPMPADYMAYPETVITENPPVLTVNLTRKILRAREMSCFIGGQRYEPSWISSNTFEIQSKSAIPSGRTKYNCTVPAESGGYYWLSIQWLNYQP